MRISFIKTVIAVVFIGLFSNSISAQNLLFQTMPKNKSQFGLRFMRPNFDGDDDLSILSGGYDLYFNIPISPKINLVGTLPYSAFSAKGEDNESGIGNIYFGFQIKDISKSLDNNSLSFGIFLPTVSDEHYSVRFLGAFSNYYEFQKYIPDQLTVYGNYSFYNNLFKGGMLGIEIGPNLLIPTKDDGDVEFLVHYGISGVIRIPNVTFSAELEGLVMITEDIDFEDRFIHSTAFGAQWTGSNIRPGIYYQIYLDKDIRDDVDGVLGIKVDVDLK